MADATSSWTEVLGLIPEQLHGPLMVGVGIGLALMLSQKFWKHLNGAAPASTELVVGEPSTFADLKPVRDLTERVGDLVSQLSRSAASQHAAAKAQQATAESLSKLSDLVGQLLVDMREEREEIEQEEEIQRRVQAALKEHESTTRRTAPPRRPRKPRAKPST